MTVTSLNTKVWDNNDGLHVFLGLGEAVATKAGEYEMFGGSHVTEVILDLVALTAAAPQAGGKQCIIADNVTIPNGAFIEKVEVLVLKETAGVNANLDLGLVDQDRSTEIDFNGFLAAADAFNGGTDIGGLFTYGVIDGTRTTEGGVLLGTKITNTGLLVANVETADFTAGILRIRIFWYTPLSGDL